MIDIATTFFWTFLIAFFVSAVYSVKDMHFDFGQPQIEVTSDNKIIFSQPMSITNMGFYNLGSFNISTEVADKEGFIITRGSTFTPVIYKNDTVTVTHNMTIDVNDLLQRDKNYLFNDTELKIYEKVGLSIAEVIPVQGSTNFSMPWGAPLYNFTLGKAEYTPYNLTHLKVVVPISFENHAFFDLVGKIQIQMYNSINIVVGEGQTNIETHHNSPYNGHLELYISIGGITASGHFEVYFLTALFNYGPLVIPYG
jgi:hypothetical protein